MTEFEGVVTSAFSSYGIIDDEIYFDYKIVIGEIPDKGCKVRGVKVLKGDNAYNATSVQIVEGMSLERNEVSGELDKIRGEFGYVNGVPIKIEHCVPRPVEGDLLNVLTEEFNGMVIGKSVSHTRKRRFTSHVLRVTPKICELEENSYFLRSLCPRGYNPQPNDIVCGVAVECFYRNLTTIYSWRAIEIKQTSITLKGLNEDLLLYRLPKFCLSYVARECDRGQKEDSISCTPHALRIGHLNPGDTTQLQFTLKNNSERILFELGNISVSDTSILNCGTPFPRYIYPQATEEITLGLVNPDIGQHTTTVIFSLSVNSKQFNICRRVHVNVIAPRTKKCLRTRVDEPFLEGCQIIPGFKPARTNPRFYPQHFPVYAIPEDVESTSEDRILAEELKKKNYKVIMHKLLYMEERFVEEEMKHYSIYETSLMKRGRFLVLKVPNLVESKLNILIGHRVVLEHENNTVKYEGYIHKIADRTDEVMLGFDESYHNSYAAESVNVHFSHSRTSFIRCHLAIDYIFQIKAEGMLFPEDVNVRPPHFNVPRLDLFNKSLNKEQAWAVLHMIEAKARPIPYLLFGPPGTGKTVTIVEAILQIFHLQDDCRILVTAPSNSACDLIAQRLLQQSSQLDIVRLNSMSRFTESLPEELQAISMPADEVKEAALKRIIVSTCVTAGNLYKLQLRTSHFTHVFIDEAGQAIEPEVLLPIALSTGPGTQAILAGDPYQLGPVIKNGQCEDLGLSMSLLERYMSCDVYERKEQFRDNSFYDPILLTKLIRNYRSHSELLIVPSQLFYDNELEPFAPHSLVNRVVNMDLSLPNPKVPFIFHGVVGEEMKENNNPSLYNPTEIVQVLTYIKLFTNAGFSSSEIGVITPYRKQAEKTRMMLQSIKDVDVRQIKVASVEDFQGQERPIIIISTVRSNNSLPSEKVKLLGFLQNPKRFNVAITRGQAMLVVVGNPDVLKHDEQWGALLDYAISRECYVGCQFHCVESGEMFGS
ncbi:helicase MOV-10-like [Bolinopsis microptera]|uniref:helicase MOV-10-like n=1 Tax=Bolinopsis microptera TaxID=2820187 RepID=UPI00307A74D3